MHLVSQAWRIVARPELELNATADQSSGKVQKRRIPTEVGNIHMVFDLEALSGFVHLCIRSIGCGAELTANIYVSVANFMSITSKKANKQAIVYNLQPLYEAPLKVD